MTSQAQKDANARYRASEKGKATIAAWYAKPEIKAKSIETTQNWKKSNPLKYLLVKAKSRARLQGLDFALTPTDFPVLPTHCPILGLELKYIQAKAKMGDPCIATLDKLDSSKGYVVGNVAIVSLRANRLKSDASLAELKMLASWLEGAMAK